MDEIRNNQNRSGLYFSKKNNIVETKVNVESSKYSCYEERILQFAKNIGTSPYYSQIIKELNNLRMGDFCNNVDIFLSISRKYYPTSVQSLVVKEIRIAIEGIKKRRVVVMNSLPITSVSYSILKKYGKDNIVKMLNDYEEKLYQDDSEIVKTALIKYRDLMNNYCDNVYDYDFVIDIAYNIGDELKKEFQSIKRKFYNYMDSTGSRQLKSHNVELITAARKYKVLKRK